MIPVTTLASFPWWAESPMWTTSMCRTGCPVPRSHMPSYAYLFQDCHTECIRLSSQIYWSCLWNHPALVESWWNLVPWIIQMDKMVPWFFRIQIIQIYSDDFRWQCWLQSCGSPWFSPIKNGWTDESSDGSVEAGVKIAGINAEVARRNGAEVLDFYGFLVGHRDWRSRQ